MGKLVLEELLIHLSGKGGWGRVLSKKPPPKQGVFGEWTRPLGRMHVAAPREAARSFLG